jgi:hypothetical protein
MKTFARFLLVITLAFLALLITIAANAQPTYHISPTGNDASDGTTPATAWRSLQRVPQYGLPAGTKILLQRGAVHRGHLVIGSYGTTAAPITVGAYGTGADPVLTGSDVITSWQLHSGKIWKARVTTEPKYVYQAGALQALARVPNTGLLTNDNGSDTYITDAGLPSGTHTGAELVVRTQAWSIDRTNITSHTGTTIRFASIGDNLGQHAFGYFLQGKLAYLDAPGEWYYDKSTSMLYLHAVGGVDPRTVTIEAAVRPIGIHVEYRRTNIILQGIHLQHFTQHAVYSQEGIGVHITGCTLSNSYQGIKCALTQGGSITDNTFRDLYDLGIHLTPSIGMRVERNTLTDIATRFGMGDPKGWSHFGIRDSGKDNVIRRNRLERVGYIGIGIEGNTVCEENVIIHACTLLNDGSGIATENVDGARMRRNIILYTLGGNLGLPVTYEGYGNRGKGLYYGEKSQKNTWAENNIVIGCNGPGAFRDNPYDAVGNHILGNIFFGNTTGTGESDWASRFAVENEGKPARKAFDHQFTGNTIVCTKPEQLGLAHINRFHYPVDFGTYSGNTYINPWSTTVVERTAHQHPSGTQRYTLPAWQQLTGDDLNSTALSTVVTWPQDTGMYKVLVNTDSIVRSITTPTGSWQDLAGQGYAGFVTLQPYSGIVIRKGGSAPPPPPPPPAPTDTSCTTITGPLQCSTWVNGRQTCTQTITRTCEVKPSSVDFTTVNWIYPPQLLTATAIDRKATSYAHGKVNLTGSKVTFTFTPTTLAHFFFLHNSTGGLELQTDGTVKDTWRGIIVPGIKFTAGQKQTITIDLGTTRTITALLATMSGTSCCNGNAVQGLLENLNVQP